MATNSTERMDFLLEVLKRMYKRMSIGQIAKDPKIKRTKRTVHLAFMELAKMEYAKNARPKQALGWDVTLKGEKWLREEGQIE